MDPAIIQILAERMELSEEEITALERGQVSRVMTQRFANDPTMAPLLQLMREKESSDEDSPVRERPRDATKLENQLRRARREVLALREELRSAHTIIAYLAEMLGACPHCFGEDEDCEDCAGLGEPGSQKPAAKRLLTWVTPALQRLGLRITKIRTSDNDTKQTSS